MINNYAGLEYITIKSNQDSIEMTTLLKIEKRIAIQILKTRPLRGKELNFLRKHLGLSCAKLSTELASALDPSTISRLERKLQQRISPVNQTFLLIFFCEKLGLKLKASIKNMIPSHSPKSIEITA